MINWLLRYAQTIFLVFAFLDATKLSWDPSTAGSILCAATILLGILWPFTGLAPKESTSEDRI